MLHWPHWAGGQRRKPGPAEPAEPALRGRELYQFRHGASDNGCVRGLGAGNAVFNLSPAAPQKGSSRSSRFVLRRPAEAEARSARRVGRPAEHPPTRRASAVRTGWHSPVTWGRCLLTRIVWPLGANAGLGYDRLGGTLPAAAVDLQQPMEQHRSAQRLVTRHRQGTRCMHALQSIQTARRTTPPETLIAQSHRPGNKLKL